MELSKSISPKKPFAENLNPNVSLPKPSNSNSSNNKSQKSVITMRPRKFVHVVSKKNNPNKNRTEEAVSCNCKDKGNDSGIGKCPCVAYQSLRASQEEFFKNRAAADEDIEEVEEEEDYEEVEEEEEEEAESPQVIEDRNNNNNEAGEEEELEGISRSGVVKRRRERLLEEARNSVPENGAGRVMHLVKAFERLLSIPNSKKKEVEEGEDDKDDNGNKNNKKEVMKWALPGLQNSHGKSESETDVVSDSGAASVSATNSSLFCASDLVLTSQSLGFDQRVSISSSWDSSRRASVSSRTSSGGRRSRRNSLESSSGTFGGRRWKKKQQQQLKVTSQKPFKLRTEQRGKMKEEEFMNKIQQMMEEQEKLRIPIAQGLPWTTDEPECLVKPQVKESTKPINLKLHSDVRAIDRAEFDHQVAEKMSLMEQYKLERERQQKLEEEEEIRRLRKELVPKAQPMPYFDRPFVPRRSMKHPTVPKEPRFHIPQHKKIKCYMSWNDMNPYSSYLN